MKKLSILHTSDWHLGRSLAGVDRTEDFRYFLAWLLRTITDKHIDFLLIAGDVFDTTIPSTQAQHLYYEFLRRLADTPLKACVITSGNHDSQKFLCAPKELLLSFRVYIAGDTIDSQALVLTSDKGEALVGIGAVPWLREGMISTSEENSSAADRYQNWRFGLAQRYMEVRNLLTAQLSTHIPLISMGHLFVTGSAINRRADDFYVGSLRNVNANALGPWSYVALGHIHRAQQIRDALSPTFYCGSPLQLDFSEQCPKKVILATFEDENLANVEWIDVPQPRQLFTLQGSTTEQLLAALQQTALSAPNSIVECIYNGPLTMDRQRLIEALTVASQEANIHLAAIRLQSFRDPSTTYNAIDERSLDDLSASQIFDGLLAEANVMTQERPRLKAALEHIWHDVQTHHALRSGEDVISST